MKKFFALFILEKRKKQKKKTKNKIKVPYAFIPDSRAGRETHRVFYSLFSQRIISHAFFVFLAYFITDSVPLEWPSQKTTILSA